MKKNAPTEVAITNVMDNPSVPNNDPKTIMPDIKTEISKIRSVNKILFFSNPKNFEL